MKITDFGEDSGPDRFDQAMREHGFCLYVPDNVARIVRHDPENCRAFCWSIGTPNRILQAFWVEHPFYPRASAELHHKLLTDPDINNEGDWAQTLSVLRYDKEGCAWAELTKGELVRCIPLCINIAINLTDEVATIINNKCRRAHFQGELLAAVEHYTKEACARAWSRLHDHVLSITQSDLIRAYKLFDIDSKFKREEALLPR